MAGEAEAFKINFGMIVAIPYAFASWFVGWFLDRLAIWFDETF